MHAHTWIWTRLVRACLCTCVFVDACFFWERERERERERGSCDSPQRARVSAGGRCLCAGNRFLFNNDAPSTFSFSLPPSLSRCLLKVRAARVCMRVRTALMMSHLLHVCIYVYISPHDYVCARVHACRSRACFSHWNRTYSDRCCYRHSTEKRRNTAHPSHPSSIAN